MCRMLVFFNICVGVFIIALIDKPRMLCHTAKHSACISGLYKKNACTDSHNVLELIHYGKFNIFMFLKITLLFYFDVAANIVTFET